MSAGETVHGVCLLLGETGILIRGASGTGKTMLARALIDAALARGGFARLVADDRVRLSRRGGRLLARPHPAIAGRMELRHTAIAAVPHEPAAVIGLIVDLVETPPARLPGSGDLGVVVADVRLPRLVFPAGQGWLLPAAVEAGLDFLVTSGCIARIAPNPP